MERRELRAEINRALLILAAVALAATAGWLLHLRSEHRAAEARALERSIHDQHRDLSRLPAPP